MGILRKLFYRPPPYKAYIKSIQHAANEMERTFSGMIVIHREDMFRRMSPDLRISAAGPSACGVYRVRLFASLFWPTAYNLAYDSVQDSAEFIMVVAKTARIGSSLDNDSLGKYGERFTGAIRPIIEGAYKAGPLVFGAPLAPEHSKLIEVVHNLLADEIGPDSYTAEVRERMRVPVEANVSKLFNEPTVLFKRLDARNPFVISVLNESAWMLDFMKPEVSGMKSIIQYFTAFIKSGLFRQMCGRFPSSRLIFCECSGMDLSRLLS